MEAPVGLGDGDVVDARFAPAHQPLLVELPLLVAVGAEPAAAGVVPFVLEAHGDAVAVERPQILDQPVVELLLPLAREEADDRRAALDEFRTVSPATVLGIGERHPRRIAAIPGVFGISDYLAGRLDG